MEDVVKTLQQAVEVVDQKKAALEKAQTALNLAQLAFDSSIDEAQKAHKAFAERIAQSVPALRAGGSRTI